MEEGKKECSLGACPEDSPLYCPSIPLYSTDPCLYSTPKPVWQPPFFQNQLSGLYPFLAQLHAAYGDTLLQREVRGTFKGILNACCLCTRKVGWRDRRMEAVSGPPLMH